MRLPTALISSLALVATLATGAPQSPADRYRAVAARILGSALVDEGAWRKLDHLTTRIGNRLSGSEGLDQAVHWAADGMRADGLENVRLQPVKVPRWVRGQEWARVVSPIPRALHVLGLGLSVGTPGAGITAPVVVAASFDALGRERVAGKIVAFVPEWEGYGKTVRYRAAGASAAARLGALAVPGLAPRGHAGDPEDPKAARALASLREIGSLLGAIDASRVEWGGGGEDIGPLMRDGVPGLSLDTVAEHYFDWHHTDGDTLDKVQPSDLQRAVAMLALMGYVLADMPERLVP